MTIRELIEQLKDVDDEVLDYEVGVVARLNLTSEVRLSCMIRDLRVPENVDVDRKIMWLKARNDD